jgi:hypothetical protein
MGAMMKMMTIKMTMKSESTTDTPTTTGIISSGPEVVPTVELGDIITLDESMSVLVVVGTSGTVIVVVTLYGTFSISPLYTS